MDTSSRTARCRSLRSDAEEAMKSIVNENSTLYHGIAVKKFRSSHQGDLLKSKQFEKYLVFVHGNILFHASWMLCPYFFNKNCTLSSGIFQIDTKKEGTNPFGSTYGPMKNPLPYSSGTRFRYQLQG